MSGVGRNGYGWKAFWGANTGAESQKRSRVPKDEIWIDYG